MALSFPAPYACFMHWPRNFHASLPLQNRPWLNLKALSSMMKQPNLLDFKLCFLCTLSVQSAICFAQMPFHHMPGARRLHPWRQRPAAGRCVL